MNNGRCITVTTGYKISSNKNKTDNLRRVAITQQFENLQTFSNLRQEYIAPATTHFFFAIRIYFIRILGLKFA